MRKSNVGMGVLLAVVVLFSYRSFPVWASDYPTRPIQFLVPYGPGGVSDIQGRALVAAAEPLVSQPFAVQNKPGAGGTLMMSVLGTSKPDGYTIGITPGSLAVVPYFQNVNYDLTKDFTYLAALTVYTENFTVRAEAPWKTMKELLDYARQNPNKVTVGTAGLGVSPSVMMKVVGKQAGIEWTEIPFKSNAQVITALLGGHIDVGAVSGENIPHVKDGKLRILAMATSSRVQDFPDVPTLRDLGYDFVALSYCGIVGPKGLPEPVIRKLEAVFQKARSNPLYIESIKKVFLFPMEEVGEDFRKRMIENYLRIGNYLKK